MEGNGDICNNANNEVKKYFSKTVPVVTFINFLLNKNIKGLGFVFNTVLFLSIVLSLDRPHKTNCKPTIPNQCRKVY